MGPMFLKMYYVYTITLLYMRIALMSQSVTCRVQIRHSRPDVWMVLSHSNEKLDEALALAGLATQVYALFAVAVALGGARTTPGPANPFLPTARAAKTLRGACAAIWP